MKTKELIKEIRKLPFKKRLFVIERSMQLLRSQMEDDQMIRAVNELCEDYKSDLELTAFTELDLESFYEAR